MSLDFPNLQISKHVVTELASARSQPPHPDPGKTPQGQLFIGHLLYSVNKKSSPFLSLLTLLSHAQV
jgi:hypothetical protein